MKLITLLIWIGLSLHPLASSLLGQDNPIPPKTDLSIDFQSDLLKQINFEKIRHSGEPSDTLTLEEAVALTLFNNPVLHVSLYDINISKADAYQQSRRPNPEFEFEFENFAGSEELAGIKSSETLISVGQLIEMSNKRQKRIKSAELNQELSIWDYREKSLELYAVVAKSFLEVLAAQEKVRLSQDLADLAIQFRNTIEARVESGGLSTIDLSRANIEVVNAQIDLKREENALLISRVELASLWGKKEVVALYISGRINPISTLPAIETLTERLVQNPSIARWQTEKKFTSANYNLEKSNGIPDPFISLGYRRMSAEDNGAFVAGVSIPLPIFDRNKGRSMAAADKVIQTDWQEYNTTIQFKTELLTTYRLLELQMSNLNSYQSMLLPEAQNTFEKIMEGYNMGKYDFLDVIDAQRVLFEIKRDYMDLLLDSNLSALGIEILINQKIQDIKG